MSFIRVHVGSVLTKLIHRQTLALAYRVFFKSMWPERGTSECECVDVTMYPMCALRCINKQKSENVGTYWRHRSVVWRRRRRQFQCCWSEARAWQPAGCFSCYSCCPRIETSRPVSTSAPGVNGNWKRNWSWRWSYCPSPRWLKLYFWCVSDVVVNSSRCDVK